VSISDCTVPVRADHQRGALDLKGRVRSRSDRTRSVKSCVWGPWIMIGRREKKERGKTYRLGFRWAAPARLRTSDWLWWRSGGFWGGRSGRQGVGSHGELACVVSVVVRFRQRRREAAGDVRCVGVLWLWASVSIYCRINEAERSGGCVRAREEERCQPRASGPPEIAEIGVAHRRYLQASSRNSAAASRWNQGESKGEEGRGVGVFIEGRILVEGVRVRAQGEIDGGEASGLGRSPARGRREVLTGGAKRSAGGGDLTHGSGVPVWAGTLLGQGRNGVWARRFPPASFLFFLFFLLFYFCFPI
jgi:hypothetical protein